MRNGILGSLVMVWLGVGTAAAQYPPYGYGQPPAPGYPPYPYGNAPAPVSYSYPQQPGMVYANPNAADEEIQAPNQPMYFSDPSKPAQNNELVPAGFLHRKHAEDGGHADKFGLKGKIGSKLYLPPQPKGVIQGGVNGGGVPAMRVVGADYVDGPPNQPRLHDNRTSCPADCPKDCGGFDDTGLDFIPYTPPGYCMYANMDFLYWWINRTHIPPLLATDFLDTPGVGVLVDHLNPADNGQRYGGRFTLGFWVEPSQRQSVEATFLFLAPTQDTLALGPFRDNAVRPFVDATTGTESGSILANPADSTVGTFTMRESTQLWSWELNLRNEIARSHWYHYDWTLGGRVLGFEDGLQIRDVVRQEQAGVNALGSVSRVDDFQATNLVYGPQVGMLLEVHRGRWFANLWNKTLIGINHEEVNIHGNTLGINAFGDQSFFQGGLLALQTNSGIHRTDRFAIMPETGLNAGVQLTEHLRISTGYTALYLNRVVRPGEQIDRTINPTAIPAFQGGGAPNLVGPARPQFTLQETDFWAHGINASVELRY